MNRRNFFFASSGAAAGAVLVPGFAEAEDDGKSPFADSGLSTGKPKPLRHNEVPGFLSAAQIAPHHTAHYGGALKAFVGADAKFEESFTKGTAIDPAAFERLKQIQSSRGNSVVLHEMYFDGLALKGPHHGHVVGCGEEASADGPAGFVAVDDGVHDCERGPEADSGGDGFILDEFTQGSRGGFGKNTEILIFVSSMLHSVQSIQMPRPVRGGYGNSS